MQPDVPEARGTGERRLPENQLVLLLQGVVQQLQLVASVRRAGRRYALLLAAVGAGRRGQRVLDAGHLWTVTAL